MRNALLVLVSVFPLAVGVRLAPGLGEPVIVECYRSEPMTVDLLAVRDSAIVVSLVQDLSEDILSHQPGVMRVIPFREIASVHLEGSNKGISYALAGSGIGALSGCGVGYLAGEGSHDPLEGLGRAIGAGVGALVGGAAGCAIGCAVGSNVRDEGSDLVTPAQRNFDSLRRYARYPAEEPQWLRLRMP